MVFGPRMAAARKAKGLTQKDLAEKLDLKAGTIQQYELGKRRPDIDMLRSISGILGVSVDSLVRIDEPNDEYELICDTFHTAGYSVTPAGYCRGPDSDWDMYFVAPLTDPDDPETRREVEYYRLAELCHKVLADAEKHKEAYIQRRISADFSVW